MRIAMVGQRGVPATHGGVERYVEELGARLVARGHEVTVYVRRNYAAERPTTHRGIRLAYLPTIGTKHLDAIVHTALCLWASRGKRYDVIHFQGIGPGLLVPLAKVSSSAVIVLTVHGLDQERGKWGWFARRALSIGCWVSAHLPDATIANARWLVAYYATRYRKTLRYVPNGVVATMARIPGSFSRDLKLDPGRYLLFVARFVPEKGVETLLYAFSGLKTDFKLVVVGDSTYSNAYVRRVRRLAERDRRVVLTGFVYGDELAELFSNTALFLTASFVEGMPLTLLTAVGYGVPVIATNIPAHAEALGRSEVGHLLVAAGDRLALARAIEDTLGDLDGARQAARRNRERILEHYNWDDAAALTEQVYRQALARA